MRLICLGFTCLVTGDVVPELRKNHDVFWMGPDQNESSEKPDIDDLLLYYRTYKDYPNLSKEALPIYDKVHAHLIQFMNAQVRHYGSYNSQTFFDLIDAFNQYFNVLSKIVLEFKPDAIIFSYSPHDGHAFVLYHIAKAMGIKTMMFMHATYFPNRVHYYFDLEDLGDLSKLPPVSNPIIPPYRPGFNQAPTEPPYALSVLSKKRKPPKWLFTLKMALKKSPFLKTFGSFFLHEKFSIVNFSYAVIKYSRKRQFMLNEARYTKLNVNLNEKFIYFPLHFQPEVVTALFGGDYFDQILALEKLALFLPDDCKIPGGWGVHHSRHLTLHF